MEFFNQLSTFLLEEITSQTKGVVRYAKRQVLLFVLKAACMVLSIVILSLGIILLGAKYVGVDLMLVAVGMVLLLAFVLIK